MFVTPSTHNICEQLTQTLPLKSHRLPLPQIQMYGFNAELYRNMSEARLGSNGIVGLSILIQVSAFGEWEYLGFFICCYFLRDSWEFVCVFVCVAVYLLYVLFSFLGSHFPFLLVSLFIFVSLVFCVCLFVSSLSVSMSLSLSFCLGLFF